MSQCFLSRNLRTAWRCCALVGLFALINASAPGQIVLTPQREDGLYGPGQTAGWTVATAEQTTTTTRIHYTIRKNGVGEPIDQGTLALTSGSATIESALPEPGAITLSVRALDDSSAVGARNAPEP